MTIASEQPVTLALGQFEDIIARGLQSLVEDDPRLRLVATDVTPEEIGRALSTHTPDVALLNFGSLARPADLRDLHAAHPQTRLLVLASNPSSAECRQMIGFGATACLAQSTEARDVLHAIHLAARGLHVLPPAAPDVYEPIGPAPLTAWVKISARRVPQLAFIRAITDASTLGRCLIGTGSTAGLTTSNATVGGQPAIELSATGHRPGQTGRLCFAATGAPLPLRYTGTGPAPRRGHATRKGRPDRTCDESSGSGSISIHDMRFSGYNAAGEIFAPTPVINPKRAGWPASSPRSTTPSRCSGRPTRSSVRRPAR